MSSTFKTATFTRWLKKSSLTDADLCRSVAEMKQGLIDVHLGGHVVKKRVAPAGRGKSGASRTLVATNLASRWYFLFGFDKNERDVPPILSSTVNWSPIPQPKEIGREEAIFRRADHRIPA